jgi:hypothetical protein
MKALAIKSADTANIRFKLLEYRTADLELSLRIDARARRDNSRQRSGAFG